LKLAKILVASSIAFMVLLAAPAAASVNSSLAPTSGSVVQIQPYLIHTTTFTGQVSHVASVSTITPTTAHGSNVISLKGIIKPQTVAVSATSVDPNVMNASTTVVPIMPQVPVATNLTASEQQMVDEINQVRAAAGVAPVKVDLRLVTASRIKAEDLYLNHYFSHVSPNFGYTGSLLPGLGLNVGYWSENVAGNNSVDGAMTAFMSSIGHRVNILDPNVNYVGVGVLEGISPYNLYVQEFVHE